MKYLKTTEVAELTGRPYNEILSLANTGVLPGYKTRRGRWRLKVEAVEEYFGIHITDPTLSGGKPASKTKSPKTDKQSCDGKLICGRTARKYLNCSKAEFENLVSQGLIQAYRDEDYRWKVSKESLLKYANRLHSSSDTRLIINENHYQEVIERICKAKSSIKIMTGDFKRFNLKPTKEQGKDYKDGTPFVKYLLGKAVDGVSVQIICSKPSSFFMDEWKDYYQQMNKPELFDFKFCVRNHAKAIIIDDNYAYIGSANVTPAGLGQGLFTPGNFEAGIITENQDLVSSVNALFSEIWASKSCNNCHRADKCLE